MRRLAYLVLPLLAVSCFQGMNDLVHEEVVAHIIEFEIENQVSASISAYSNTVEVTMPAETDATQLKITRFVCTEGALVSPDNIAAGSVIDLSEPMEIVLTTYDSYTWTLTANVLVAPEKPEEPENPPVENPTDELTKDGPQLYNMGMDLWHNEAGEDSYPMYFPYADEASEEEQAVWGAWPQTMIAFDMPTVMPEFSFLAESGEGKAALKLETKENSENLAAGLLVSGKAQDFFPWLTTYFLGTPFTARPAALELQACYKPQIINYSQAPFNELAGEPDNAGITVILVDWENQFEVTPPGTLLDFANDPGIIGYGKVVLDSEMDDYERIQVNIGYRDERTPTMVAIIITSSNRGDYGTGAVGSILYVDEMAFLYEASE